MPSSADISAFLEKTIITEHSRRILDGLTARNTATAAYRSGETITNEYDGVTHDYTRKGGIVHTEILLPDHAPAEYADRAVLWNAVENVNRHFVAAGMCADFAIHDKQDGKPHAHIMLTMHPIEKDGKWGRNRAPKTELKYQLLTGTSKPKPKNGAARDCHRARKPQPRNRGYK